MEVKVSRVIYYYIFISFLTTFSRISGKILCLMCNWKASNEQKVVIEVTVWSLDQLKITLTVYQSLEMCSGVLVVAFSNLSSKVPQNIAFLSKDGCKYNSLSFHSNMQALKNKIHPMKGELLKWKCFCSCKKLSSSRVCRPVFPQSMNIWPNISRGRD